MPGREIQRVLLKRNTTCDSISSKKGKEPKLSGKKKSKQGWASSISYSGKEITKKHSEIGESTRGKKVGGEEAHASKKEKDGHSKGKT